MSFGERKHLRMGIRWHFCDDARQEVKLGGPMAFVDGVSVWERSSIPSPARDGAGRFVYDAILQVRDARPAEHRWLYGREDTGVLMEPFDLEQEPRDVCVAIWLYTKMGGRRTKTARIPREEIAAALGVEVPSAAPERGAAAR